MQAMAKNMKLILILLNWHFFFSSLCLNEQARIYQDPGFLPYQDSEGVRKVCITKRN